MVSKQHFIGKWLFNYWPEKSKSSIITLMEDGSAVTSNGTWYQWKINESGQISIYNEGYVQYDGVLCGNCISGNAVSEYSGNIWSWNAIKHNEPIITPINKLDLPIGWWTLVNEIEEVDNNVVEFQSNGVFKSKNYPSGKWYIDEKGLNIITAGGFLRYYAKCVDGIISGKCRNRIGTEWLFRLEHTCVPLSISQLPTSKTTVAPLPTKTHIQSNTKKVDSQQIINYLQENGIHFFYHFTAKKNIPSILEHKGLYSWKYLLDHGILIPDPGGDEWSRELDANEGLEDYVRLSFCIDHPMKYRKRNSNPVLLKIDIEVATYAETLFSDMNAASPKHKHGKKLSDLKRVDINATQRTYVSRDDPDFHTHQAEVMVKTYLPLKYILNINDFK